MAYHTTCSVLVFNVLSAFQFSSDKLVINTPILICYVDVQNCLSSGVYT